MTAPSERPLVVVVDDEPGILRAVSRLLREDCEVATTTSPWEACQWVREREVDVVVSDHSMPGMPGTELLDRISEISPKTATLMLTAHRGRATLHPGGRRAERAVVDKPWDDAQFRGLIRGLLGKGRPR
jgi:CheY-like chemotaxis protein